MQPKNYRSNQKDKPINNKNENIQENRTFTKKNIKVEENKNFQKPAENYS
jgi:hypothetical protein